MNHGGKIYQDVFGTTKKRWAESLCSVTAPYRPHHQKRTRSSQKGEMPPWQWGLLTGRTLPLPTLWSHYSLLGGCLVHPVCSPLPPPPPPPLFYLPFSLPKKFQLATCFLQEFGILCPSGGNVTQYSYHSEGVCGQEPKVCFQLRRRILSDSPQTMRTLQRLEEIIP